ncbi:15302_t:CDS:2, partial [Acaulospora colombiana]
GYLQDDSQFTSPTQPSTSRTDRTANAPFNNQEIYSPTHVHDHERELPPLPDQPNQRGSYQQPARTWVNGSPTDGNGAARRGGGPDDEVVHVEAKPVGRPEVQENTTHRALDANQERRTAHDVTMITLGVPDLSSLIRVQLIHNLLVHQGSGTALYEGGPLGILIAFGFVGAYQAPQTEMEKELTALLHDDESMRGFVGFASRYIHPAVGFGLGWTYVFQFLFVPASHINTAAIVMEYSGYTVSLDYQPIGSSNPVPVAVWRLIF